MGQSAPIEAKHRTGAPARTRNALWPILVLEVDPDRRNDVFRQVAALQDRGARVVAFEEPPR